MYLDTSSAAAFRSLLDLMGELILAMLNLKKLKTGLCYKIMLKRTNYFSPGFETLFFGGGGELLVDAAILLFSFFFLLADLSEVSEIFRKKSLK